MYDGNFGETVQPSKRLGLKLRNHITLSLFDMGVLLVLYFSWMTLCEAKPPETKAEYSALKGQSFSVSRMGKSQDSWSKAVDLILVDIIEPVQDKSSKTDQFILRFSASSKEKTLEKSVHRLEHAATGPFTLFLEPAGGDKKYQYYQAIFNLLK